MEFNFHFFFWWIIHGISLPQEKMLHKTLTEIQQETQGNIPKYQTNILIKTKKHGLLGLKKPTHSNLPNTQMEQLP